MNDAELAKKIRENPYKIKLITHSRGPPTWEISVSGEDKDRVFAEIKEIDRKMIDDFKGGQP
jgi:hypothetical protein